jgi:hypothetical protein
MSIMIFALMLLSMIHALSDDNLQIEVLMSLDKNLIGSMDIASPQCRQSAIGIFSDWKKSMGYKNNNWCRELTYLQQQHLALELTKCHLDELMQDTFEVSPCTCSVQECLTQLTPQGVQCYTLFHLHVEQYCIRLNQEWMIAQQYETTQQLQHAAQRATEQWTSWLNQHDNLTMDVKQILGGLRNEYLEWHETHLEVTMKRQQLEMEQYLKSIMKDTWNDQLLQPMKLVVQFWKDWTSKVSNAVAQSSWMWNFVSSLFLDGFDIVYGIIYTMVELSFQWIITKPKFLRTCRRILWSISLLEFSALLLWKIICAYTLICSFKYDLMSHVRTISFSFQVIALISCLLDLFRWKRRVTPVDPSNTTDMVVTMEMMKIALNRVQHQLHTHERQLEESTYRSGLLSNGTIEMDPFVSHRRRLDAPYLLPGHGHVNEFILSPMTRKNLNSNFISPEGMNAKVSSTILSYPERRSMAGDNHDRSSFLPVVDTPIVHSGDSIVHNDDDNDDTLDDDTLDDDCNDAHDLICQDSCTSIETTTEGMNPDVLHGETDHARLSRTMKKKRQRPEDEELEPAWKRQHCEDTVTL